MDYNVVSQLPAKDGSASNDQASLSLLNMLAEVASEELNSARSSYMSKSLNQKEVGACTNGNSHILSMDTHSSNGYVPSSTIVSYWSPDISVSPNLTKNTFLSSRISSPEHMEKPFLETVSEYSTTYDDNLGYSHSEEVSSTSPSCLAYSNDIDKSTSISTNADHYNNDVSNCYDQYNYSNSSCGSSCGLTSSNNKKFKLDTDQLTLNQIATLSALQLTRLFSTSDGDEVRRKYYYKCHLLPDSCTFQASSFGSEHTARTIIGKHLLNHIKALMVLNESDQRESLVFISLKKKKNESCCQRGVARNKISFSNRRLNGVRTCGAPPSSSSSTKAELTSTPSSSSEHFDKEFSRPIHLVKYTNACGKVNNGPQHSNTRVYQNNRKQKTTTSINFKTSSNNNNISRKCKVFNYSVHGQDSNNNDSGHQYNYQTVKCRAQEMTSSDIFDQSEVKMKQDESFIRHEQNFSHIERDEHKLDKKPKGRAKFIGQSKAEKEMAMSLIAEMRSQPLLCLESLECKICQPARPFTAPSTLLSHYRSHAGICPFVCSICSAVFTRQHSLNYHLLIHNNQTRFTCDDCGRKFRHPSHFKEHRRRHTGESPYQCLDCLSKFKTRNTYKRHLLTRHNKQLTTDGEVTEAPTTSDNTLQHTFMMNKTSTADKQRKLLITKSKMVVNSVSLDNEQFSNSELKIEEEQSNSAQYFGKNNNDLMYNHVVYPEENDLDHYSISSSDGKTFMGNNLITDSKLSPNDKDFNGNTNHISWFSSDSVFKDGSCNDGSSHVIISDVTYSEVEPPLQGQQCDSELDLFTLVKDYSSDAIVPKNQIEHKSTSTIKLGPAIGNQLFNSSVQIVMAETSSPDSSYYVGNNTPGASAAVVQAAVQNKSSQLIVTGDPVKLSITDGSCLVNGKENKLITTQQSWPSPQVTFNCPVISIPKKKILSSIRLPKLATTNSISTIKKSSIVTKIFSGINSAVAKPGNPVIVTSQLRLKMPTVRSAVGTSAYPYIGIKSVTPINVQLVRRPPSCAPKSVVATPQTATHPDSQPLVFN